MSGERQPVPARLSWTRSGEKVEAVEAVAQHAFNKITAASRKSKAPRLTAEDARALDWCVQRIFATEDSANWRVEPFHKDPSHGG